MTFATAAACLLVWAEGRVYPAACSPESLKPERGFQVYATHLREAQANSRPDPPLSVGFCHELCAGIIDKEKSLEDISHEEVWHLILWLWQGLQWLNRRHMLESASFLMCSGGSVVANVSITSNLFQKHCISLGLSCQPAIGYVIVFTHCSFSIEGLCLRQTSRLQLLACKLWRPTVK